MDLLTHIAAGIAVGTTIAVCSKGNAVKKITIVCGGALGGALPDIDAISLWSKFDTTFGRLFSLSHTGKEIYSAKFWYSHHAFMHSLAACVLFSFILLAVIYLANRRAKKEFTLLSKANIAIPAAFASGYIAHLVCDMPTPASSWAGVNLFFPINVYIGGWGKIWWWNNYDIFLISSGVIAVNVLLLIFSNVLKHKHRYFSFVLLAAAATAVAIQISTRDFDFNSHTYQECEAQSKKIQKKIVGKTLYDKMEKFDDAIPLYF